MSCIKFQQGVSSASSDEYFLFIKQQGIKYVFGQLTDEDANYEGIMRLQERLARYDLTLTDAGNTGIYKNASIHLGLTDRDEHIGRYNELTRALGRAGVHIGYMTWEPNQVLTSRFDIGEHTLGSTARIVDIEQLKTLSFSHGRQYTKEETWANFKYFLDKAIPVCEEADVRIALHPCDPPVPALRGIYNLIHCADDYRRAFELSNNSPFLGMKLCCGCWLEGGASFGNILNDIAEFVADNKVLIVHFRNVSAVHPYFEETLLENGYMDMYEVMKQFVRYGYNGYLNIDHVPEFEREYGGKNAAFAYTNGYAKALLKCAESDLEKIT